MNKREKIIKKCFLKIQKIPYSINGNNCFIKSEILLKELKKYNIYGKMVAIKYKLNSGLEEQKYIPGEYDIHYFVKVGLNNKIIFLDVSYDVALKGLFLVVKYNNGKGTNISHKAIGEEIFEKKSKKFKKIHFKFCNELNIQYRKYQIQLDNFSDKYEKIICKYRGK